MGKTWKEMTEPVSLEEYAGETIRPIPRPDPPQISWVQLPQKPEAGESDSGYYVYGTDHTGRRGTGANGQWGEPKTMQVITSVAGHLANGKHETPFGVGNISLQGGGYFKGHNTHQDGLGIDVRPARIDKEKEGVSYHHADYDRAATQRLVDAFRATGAVDTIYFNDPEIQGVTPDKPGGKTHDNHLHVKVRR